MKPGRLTTFGGVVWIIIIAALVEHWRGTLEWLPATIGFLLLAGWCMAQGKRAPERDPLEDVMASLTDNQDKGNRK